MGFAHSSPRACFPRSSSPIAAAGSAQEMTGGEAIRGAKEAEQVKPGSPGAPSRARSHPRHRAASARRREGEAAPRGSPRSVRSPPAARTHLLHPGAQLHPEPCPPLALGAPPEGRLSLATAAAPSRPQPIRRRRQTFLPNGVRRGGAC